MTISLWWWIPLWFFAGYGLVAFINGPVRDAIARHCGGAR